MRVKLISKLILNEMQSFPVPLKQLEQQNLLLHKCMNNTLITGLNSNWEDFFCIQ